MRYLIFAVLAVMPVLSAVGQNFDQGLAAYKRGNFATALEAWRPLAAQGAAAAQYRLGVMYAYGIMVDKDYRMAREWYEKAARYTVEKGQRHRLGTLAGANAGRLFDGFDEAGKRCSHQGASVRTDERTPSIMLRANHVIE